MWKRLVCEDGTVPVLADTGINMGSPDGSPRCRTSPDAGFSAVRRLHHRADEPLPHGCDALASSAIELVSSKPLLPRMWQLRENISGYDDACMAAAEAHRCPLLTADLRLARIGGLRCEIHTAVPAG